MLPHKQALTSELGSEASASSTLKPPSSLLLRMGGSGSRRSQRVRRGGTKYKARQEQEQEGIAYNS